ncbi:MAG: type VI secretion system baseplate subunit TssF, partial [Candidatus Binataceae bacterium]
MLNRYYEEELGHLRQLAAEFSHAHPALAPMLAGPSSDPDVERVLEGVAFLAGLIRQRLDREFPEFIQSLGNMIFPHYIRVIPSCTIVTFNPKGRLNEPAKVAAGVELASNPVDGTACVFRTCYPVEVQPITLRDTRVIADAGTQPRLRLTFALDVGDVGTLRATALRLHLAGEITEATNLYLLLRQYLTGIMVAAPGGEAALLPAAALRPVGFADEDTLIPYPPHAYPGYRLLEEYFVLPQKFLFVEIGGLEHWRNRGKSTQFTLDFMLKELPGWMGPVRPEAFVLNATPAINLFNAEAEPVSLDHRASEYRLLPAGRQRTHYQIFSVDEVTGRQPGVSAPRVYTPLGLFRGDGAAAEDDEMTVYQVVTRLANIGRGLESYLSIAYQPQRVPQPEILSVRLTCTNGVLPVSLGIGDISRPTDTSPERLVFANIMPPTPPLNPPMGEALLTRILSHLALNYLSIANAPNLKSLLNLY